MTPPNLSRVRPASSTSSMLQLKKSGTLRNLRNLIGMNVSSFRSGNFQAHQ